MFENLAEAEENRGLRGFKKRHSSEFVDAEQAESSIDWLTKAFLAVTLLQLALGLMHYFKDGGPESEAPYAWLALVILGFLCYFVPILWIRFRKNRVLAVVYSLLWLFNAITFFLGRGMTFGFVPVGLFLAMSLRLAQACFAFHRFPRPAPIETATFD